MAQPVIARSSRLAMKRAAPCAPLLSRPEYWRASERSPKSARLGLIAPCSASSRARMASSQPIVMPVAAQPLELRVRIEHQRRPGEPPRDPGALRVQPDHEQRGPREAEREARIVRIVADRRIPGRRIVAVMQPLQLQPEPALNSASLVDGRRSKTATNAISGLAPSGLVWCTNAARSFVSARVALADPRPP